MPSRPLDANKIKKRHLGIRHIPLGDALSFLLSVLYSFLSASRYSAGMRLGFMRTRIRPGMSATPCSFVDGMSYTQIRKPL
jgi:hypothetical protein